MAYFPPGYLHAGAKYARIFCPAIFCMQVQDILPRNILHAGVKYPRNLARDIVHADFVSEKNIPGCFAFGCKLSRGLHAGVKSI